MQQTPQLSQCTYLTHNKPILIRQDSVVCLVEPVKVEHPIAKHENPSDICNDCSKACNPERELNQRIKCISPDARLSSTNSLLQERQTFRSLCLHCLGLYEQSVKGKIRWSVHRFTVFCWNMKMYSRRMTMTWAIPTWLNIQLTLGMQNPLSSHLDGCQ